MGTYQGDFLAYVEVAKHTPTCCCLRVRLISVRPANLVLTECIVPDARAASEIAEAQLRAVLAFEMALSTAKLQTRYD